MCGNCKCSCFIFEKIVLSVKETIFSTRIQQSNKPHKTQHFYWTSERDIGNWIKRTHRKYIRYYMSVLIIIDHHISINTFYLKYPLCYINATQSFRYLKEQGTTIFDEVWRTFLQYYTRLKYFLWKLSFISTSSINLISFKNTRVIHENLMLSGMLGQCCGFFLSQFLS